MEEIILDCDKWEEKPSIIDELTELESSTPILSSYRPSQKDDDVKALEEAESAENGEDWLTCISRFHQKPVVKGKRKSGESIFGMTEGKKKKKKKKKDGDDEWVDYGKEFEPEMALMQNLLIDQNKFVQSLQQRYDVLESSKSSARGVGKFTTDLISAINQGRSTSMQLVNAIISTKKTVADLNMKERKEKAGLAGLDGDDLNQYSANLLKNMIGQSRRELANYGDNVMVDGGPDDIFSDIAEGFTDDDTRDDDVTKFLQYETRNPKLIAVVDDETDECYLQAIAGDNGEVLADYPLPNTGKMEINRSTNVAVDEYHNKYPIEFRNKKLDA